MKSGRSHNNIWENLKNFYFFSLWMGFENQEIIWKIEMNELYERIRTNAFKIFVDMKDNL